MSRALPPLLLNTCVARYGGTFYLLLVEIRGPGGGGGSKRKNMLCDFKIFNPAAQ